MKILMATHYFASHKGGIEIVAEQLYRGLALGHEVVWIAGDSTPPPNAVGVSHPVSFRVFNLVEKKFGLPFPIPTLRALKQISSETKTADVLVLHDCLYLSNIAAFIFAKFHRVPTLIIQHIGSVAYKNPILRSSMRLANAVATQPMLRHAEQVVFISETTKNYFRNIRFKKAPEVIFNGVDTDVYHTLGSSETKSALRRSYNLPENRPTILYAGRFVEKKGISILKRMVVQRPDWMWVFAGWGPLDPSGWDCENVQAFSGVSGASLAALYRASDVFVLPSTGEGFPLVMQEALASGLPVVCSSEIALADPVMAPFLTKVPIYRGDDGRTAAEFLQAIDRIGPGSAHRSSSEERRAFAISRYSLNAALDRYLHIMTQLVKERH